MRQRFARSVTTRIVIIFLLVGSIMSSTVSAQGDATPITSGTPTAEATPVDGATPIANGEASGPVDLDVLFIGAHPDDEAGGLSTYGQWNEVNDAQVGVITVTRGEGGGNAVGTEEGPALGLLREDEERRAVGLAGVEHIYNLDKVDFYYTVSAPLTEATWGYDDTLQRVVRIIRTTKPEVITTMNPSPTPGNHGHHQLAARLAVDAFYAAADETRFPAQISDEGLSTWEVGKIVRSGGAGEGEPGPDCATTYVPADPTDVVYGVWAGNTSQANGGRTWADIEREAQRTYASQGWAAFPDAETDPAEITCDYFTLIDSRVPLSTNPESTTAVLENAVVEVPRGLPFGSQLYLTTDSFDVQAGEPFTVTSHVQVPGDVDTSEAFVTLIAPTGWEVVGAAEAEAAAAAGEDAATPVVTAAENGELTQEFTIIPAADTEVNTRYTIGASVGVGRGIGVTGEVVRVVPPVSGSLSPLPQIAQFQEWTESIGVPELQSLITPMAPIGLGGEQDLNIDVVNNTTEEQSGTVTVALPEGFETETPSIPFASVAAGKSTSIPFTVRNTDTSLATSNQGGEEGTYAFEITTEAAGVSSVQTAGLNLVPTTIVPQAATAPVVDGQIGTDEYTGEALDLSRVWEGDDPDSALDASGTGHVTWGEDGIYVAVEVVDDTLGTVLTPEDAKRHWRTDSVEIAIDPLGTAENTSGTFKVGVFPTTTAGSPAAYRDADAFQGPVSETAPGFEVASTVSEPYTGYVLETLIPWDSLPADIDPQEAATNIFIYDSDTQDLTGQTRLGWSTWNGVQGDPYRWGLTEFEGYTPANARTEPAEPKMPLDVARSIDSPLSIAQAARDGVGLAGMPAVPDGQGVQVVDGPVIQNGQVTMQIESTLEGNVNLFYEAEGAIVSRASQEVTSGSPISIELAAENATGGTVYVAFESAEGAVQALAIPVQGQ